MLPISIAGWDVREATMMVAFGYAGLNQTDGTMISLLSGATSLVVGALGGLVLGLESGEDRKGSGCDACRMKAPAPTRPTTRKSIRFVTRAALDGKCLRVCKHCTLHLEHGISPLVSDAWRSLDLARP
jgi:hypothetical protein